MRQNRFRLGLRPRPHWGSLQRSPDPYLDLRGPTSKGRGYRKEGEGGDLEGVEGRGRGRREVEGKEGREGIPVCIFKFSLE